VWAPTGIAIAALFLFGPRRLWPAVAAGAFVANATSGAGALLAVRIAAGNTLQAVAAAYLPRKAGPRSNHDRVRHVPAFVVLAAPLLLVAFASRRRRPTRRAVAEAAVLLAGLGGAAAGVFLLGGWRYPYLLFPLLIVATLRFHQLGAAAGSLVVGALATAGTV